MALDRRTRALFARHVRTQISLKLKCETQIFNNTTAMPSNPRHIVCPTGAIHPTCCSNASIARAPKAATGSIRSIISRVKSRRCGTQASGHAIGSTRAVKDDATAWNTQRTRGTPAGATKRAQAPRHYPGTLVARHMAAFGYNAEVA